MNERIKILAEKSYYECPQVTSYMWENDIVPPEQWTKFAELLIRETCGILTENVEVALNAVGSPVYPEGLIYEHFGVEE